MSGQDRREIGRLFNEVPELYDRVRPTYPDELFDDLAAITGVHQGSLVLEVGCGTGQATRSLAALGFSLTAVEPGEGMAALARERVEGFENVQIETSTFEEWNDQGRRFDLLVAAESWHWVDPSIGWPRAHGVLRPGGWMALIGNIVVCRPGEPEVYAETADLHERYCPGNPDWGHPPVRTRFARPTRAGDLSRTPARCSARRSCGGTRSSSGTTAPALLIFSGRLRCTDGSTRRPASPCSTPLPSESGPRWGTGRRAATSGCSAWDSVRAGLGPNARLCQLLTQVQVEPLSAVDWHHRDWLPGCARR